MTPIHPGGAGVLGAALLLIAAAGPVQAQQRPFHSFELLQFLVKAGDGITVVSENGDEVSGHILSLTSTELVLSADGARRSFHAGEALRIRQRRGDPLSNGAWIGAGVGVGVVAVAAAAAKGFGVTPGGVVAVGGLYAAMGAGIGVGVDALIRGQRTIYDTTGRPSASSPVATVLGPGRVGATVTWRF